MQPLSDMGEVSRACPHNTVARADFPVWHTSLHNPDWAEYARLCGAHGIKVRSGDQLDAAMAELFATRGPAMLHVEQDPELL